MSSFDVALASSAEKSCTCVPASDVVKKTETRLWNARLTFHIHTHNKQRTRTFVLLERFKLYQNVAGQARHKPVIRYRYPVPLLPELTPSYWTDVSQTTDERRAMR